MTLRQLEVFLAVAREKSFRRAALRIHLSQPALSEHVRELERELGQPLLVRGGRTVALLVGASTTPGIYVLPSVIGAFWRRYPGVELHLTIANSRVIEERVRANELDLGVVGGHVLGAGERCLTAGLLDELVLAVAPGHRWAGRREIGPRRLGEERFLVREEGSATRQVTERALQQAGVRLGASMRLDHPEAIKQGVMAGLGVAIVSRHAIRGEVATGRLHALRLRGLPIRRHFHVIHHPAREVGASARALLHLLGAGAERPESSPHPD